MALLGGAAVFAGAERVALEPSEEEEAEGPVEAKPLTLEQLIILACEHNPAIAMAQARVQAARGRLVQAGLYPNPSIVWEAEDMGGPGPHAAGAQGPILGQDIITAGKRRRAMAAAAHGVSIADWQALTRWYDVLTRTRLAYFELLAARLEVKTAEELVGLAREDLDAARKLL
jgi:cobalt-zinc-cadmium efflux system outer membrane protein